MPRSFFIVLCSLMTAVFSQGGEGILYTGLTSSGWQVYLYNPEERSSTQLTASPGDKRTPIYSDSLGAVVYRESRGRIVMVGLDGEEKFLTTLENCGDFGLKEIGGNQEPELFVTRLVTGNPQRQQIWRVVLPESLHRVAQAERGSLRQIVITGELAFATHLWQTGEERVVQLSAFGEEGNSELNYWTPSLELASYPTIVPTGGLLYSRKVSDDNYDLYFQLEPGADAKVVVGTEGFSEFASTVGVGGDRVVFERLGKDGVWSLARAELRKDVTDEIIVLPIKHPAKEPCLVELPEKWLQKK